MPKSRSSFLLQPGDRVIIRQNPHDPRYENVVGTVIRFRLEAGFGGSDLVDVRYKSPIDALGTTLPFGLSCLGPVTAEELIRLAEGLEREAAELRRLAEATDTSRYHALPAISPVPLSVAAVRRGVPSNLRSMRRC